MWRYLDRVPAVSHGAATQELHSENPGCNTQSTRTGLEADGVAEGVADADVDGCRRKGVGSAVRTNG